MAASILVALDLDVRLFFLLLAVAFGSASECPNVALASVSEYTSFVFDFGLELDLEVLVLDLDLDFVLDLGCCFAFAVSIS